MSTFKWPEKADKFVPDCNDMQPLDDFYEALARYLASICAKDGQEKLARKLLRACKLGLEAK